MTVIYLDKVFVLNLLVDYLLLLTAARVCGMPLQRVRLIICACAGAAYAVSVFLPGCEGLAHPIIRLTCGVLMGLFAYWPLQKHWRITGLFLLLSAALGGLILALGLAVGSGSAVLSKVYYAQIDWSLLLGAAFGIRILLHLLFQQAGRHGGGELMKIHLGLCGKQTEILALHDTGNTLRDPVKGQPVLVIEQAALKEIWDRQTAKILQENCSSEEKIARLHDAGLGSGFTLLPFRSVGTRSGLLLALRSDWIKVGRAEYRGAWIALIDHSVSDGGAYQALWGGVKKGEEYSEVDQSPTQVDSQSLQAG